MSYEMEKYIFNNRLNKSLYLMESGFQKCHAGHTPGTQIYLNYSITFVLSGKGTLSFNNTTYELTRGKGFVIIPGIPVSYKADTNDPWQYIYASFNGIDTETIMHAAGIDQTNILFDFPMDEAMLHDLNAMYLSGKNCLMKGYDAIGYFLLVISRLVEARSSQMSAADSDEYYIQMSLSYIDENYTRAISVSDVADYIGFDRTYFYRMFVRKMGMPPSCYMNNLRIKKAISLMEFEHLSLNDIALSTGFYDFSHFSKAFFDKYGISPGKYRKANIPSADKQKNENI